MVQSYRQSMDRRHFLKYAVLGTISILGLSFFPQKTSADAPEILKIEDLTICPVACKIRVQINHTNPNRTHYINIVEVEVDGQTTQYVQGPQKTDIFTVDIDLNDAQRRNPFVSVRAHCTIDGWGEWSNIIQIPEFSTSTAALFSAVAVSLLVIKHIYHKK